MDHAVRVHPRAVIRRQPETADKLFPVLFCALRLVRHRRVPCVGDRPQAAVPVRRRNRDGFPIRFQPPASALRHALRRHKPIRPAEFAVKVNLRHPPLLLLKQDEGKRPPRRLDLGIISPIDDLRHSLSSPKPPSSASAHPAVSRSAARMIPHLFMFFPLPARKNAAFPSVYKTREPRRLFQFFPKRIVFFTANRPPSLRTQTERPP